jgi:hypothetical protein
VQRFPGGVDQFAQMVAGLPPDLLGDLMLVEAMDDQGGMPGGLDGVDGDGAQEQVGNEDSDEETEDVPVRHIPFPG